MQSAVFAAVGVARRGVAVTRGLVTLGDTALVGAPGDVALGFVVLGVAPTRLVLLDAVADVLDAVVLDVGAVLLVVAAEELDGAAADELDAALVVAIGVDAVSSCEEEHPTSSASGRAARARRVIMR